MKKDILQKIHQWVFGDDTGLSSRFLAQLALENPLPEIHYPYDPADFGRCYRFLQILDTDLQDEVLTLASHRSVIWERYVEDWDRLVTVYLEELPSGKCPKLYEMMKKIQDTKCQTCGGTGEVRTMEQVYAGEPHVADIGTENCPDCNPPKEETEE